VEGEHEGQEVSFTTETESIWGGNQRKGFIGMVSCL
jgi:hypothetical protein